jgi:tungstate transport system substrate-binding protein
MLCRPIACLIIGLLLSASSVTLAADRFITVASTTSTENSGLFHAILPLFERATGIAVRVVAVGTGQAIRMAERGDADVLFVHHRPSEARFVADGFGVERHEVMYNDFVLVGPRDDPAGVVGTVDAVGALTQIAARRAPFASRGDDSGTHKRELALWRVAGIDVEAASGSWYRETGSGMGTTLNIASGMGAYAITDRGTWLNFNNRGELIMLVEGDRRLFNPYGVMLVNPTRHPHVKAAAGQAFINWLLSPEGQGAIAAYRIDGQPVFFPSVGSDSP